MTCELVFAKSRRPIIISTALLAVVVSLAGFHYMFDARQSDTHIVSQLSATFTQNLDQLNAGVTAAADIVVADLNRTFTSIWPHGPDRKSTDRCRRQLELTDRYAAATSTKRRAVKLILVDGGRNVDAWTDGREMFDKSRCPIRDCWITRNRSLAAVADVLVLNQPELNSRWKTDYLPKPRRQLWMYVQLESPVNDMFDVKSLGSLVNWTMTYRRDSTIPSSYGRYYPVRESGTFRPPGEQSINYAAGKTKKIAWFVSRCKARSNRMIYAMVLNRFMQVDIFGTCGKHSCPRSNSSNCLQMLSRDYKFYLAFENSHCDDYITEKLAHTALGNNILPIVLGAGRDDYASFAPTHSYIHVDDFPAGPRQLADYLRLLDNNDNLYNEYFRWKGSWKIAAEQPLCRLCALLHWRDDVDYVHWYGDFGSWWNSACERNETLPWFMRNT